MRSSGPLGSHMAARPHLAPPLPPSRPAQAAPTQKPRLAADKIPKDAGHLAPAVRAAKPQAQAEVAPSLPAATGEDSMCTALSHSLFFHLWWTRIFTQSAPRCS